MCASGRKAAWAAEGRSRQGETDSLSTRILFPTCSTRLQRSPSQTHRRCIVQITYNLVLLIYDSTTSSKETNLKVLSSLQTGRKPVVTAYRMRDLFFHHPMIHAYHAEFGKLQRNSAHRLWAVVCKSMKSSATPPRVRSTNHEKQNLFGTSLLQIVVISHPSSAWMTVPGPQGTIYSIHFGLRVPKLWLRRQSKWSAAASQSHVKWGQCQTHVAALVGPKRVWVQQLPFDLKF